MSLLNLENKENQEKRLKVGLSLSDVIEIFSPDNQVLNNQKFIIDYIDPNKIKLVNIEDFTNYQLNIKNGNISDKSIKNIKILSRDSNKGYAMQNKLLPNTWINLHIGGDTPAIIIAEITNLENDMIELKTFPDNEILYINFNYSGLPENIPIELIEKREKPEVIQDHIIDKPEIALDETNMDNLEQTEDDVESDTQVTQSLPNVKDVLKEFIISADEIQRLQILPPVKTSEEVDESKKRFSVQVQTNNLLDELLSKVPDNKRTDEVLNNIHTIIERFKQLRSEFIKFDENEEIVEDLVSYKPLVDNLLSFKKKLNWIIPVVKNMKKLYNVSSTSVDVIPENLGIDLNEIVNIINNYKSNNNPNSLNAYSDLIYRLNPYFTPFEDLNYEYNDEIIHNVSIQNEVECVLNNLNNFYSSVAENDIIKSTKFVIQKYELGVKRLEAETFKGSSMETYHVNITEPDNVALSSLLILPEQVINYSRINLPNTNISQKAQLNNVLFLLSNVLNDQTNVKNQVVNLDNLDNTILHKSFGNKIINYELDDIIDPNDSQKTYIKFLNKCIPNTDVLFRLIKKYVPKNNTYYTTFNSAIQLFEPFLIYSKDINVDEYKPLVDFVSNNISNYYKLFTSREKTFNLFKSVVASEPFNATKLTSIIPNNVDNNKMINNYNHFDLAYSNSELLWKMKLKDFANVYDNMAALSNISILLPNSINEIIKHLEEQKHIIDKELESEKKNEENKQTCANVNIAKKYKTLEELEDDNDKTIYFDKEYDTETPYELINNYQKEKSSMTPDNFYEFLIVELSNKHKFNNEDAAYVASSLINGHKEVRDGQYATYYDLNNNKLVYFKRENNKWIQDNSLNKYDNKKGDLTCWFQTDCIEVQDKYNKICETYNVNKKTLTENALREIINNFTKKYELSKDILKKKLTDELQYNNSIFQKLQQIHYLKWSKYNDEKYNLGLQSETSDNIISPYTNKMEKVLGIRDFIKKQHKILDFANKYTRPANIMFNGGSSDDINWRYCIKTNVKLLPVFYYTLAITYIQNPSEYDSKLNTIIKEIGTLSDDRDAIVDKYSGRVIMKREFDNDEGYTVDGKKSISRDVIEKEFGDSLLSAKEKTIKYSNPQSRMMYNIATAISSFMGININQQMEFIISIASKELSSPNVLPSEEEYKEKIKAMAKKGKKIDDYETLYYSTLLYFTLGAILIAIQTAIPSIKTRATYPGCIKSFTGYPFGGNGDFTGLMYLVCVVYKIKKHTLPWTTIKKKKEETISKYIKLYIDNFYLESPDVLRKFEEKIQYENIKRNDDIPIQYSLGKWMNFLPPLVPLKLKEVEQISDEFKKSLLNSLRSGSSSQVTKILLIQGRIMYFSLFIQQSIQETLTKQKWLLTNSNNEPFLENACCNDKKQITALQYFKDKSSDISLYNSRVDYLSDILDDISSITKSTSLYCNINSKNIYPPLNQEYSENTIYRAFIIFCNYNSIKPISPILKPVCYEKPEVVNYKSSINETIDKLKDNKVQYSQKEFQKLLQLVNSEHAVHIDTAEQTISDIEKMRIMLNQLKTNNEVTIEKELIYHLSQILDTFDLSLTEENEETRELKNYLAVRNKELTSEVINFIQKYAKQTTTKKRNIENFLNDIMTWGEGEPDNYRDNTTYNSINFMKTYISNFVKVFPFIIKNQVDYTSDNIDLPPQWNITSRQNNETLNVLNDYYNGLRLFYNNPILSNTLNKIHFEYIDLLNLIISTPYLSDIDDNGGKKSSILDKRTIDLLFKNYLLLILNTYVQLADDKKMIENENITGKFKIYNEDADEEDEEYNPQYLSQNIIAGNMKMLKNNISELLFVYLEIMRQHKNLICQSYDYIMDMVFKLKEREKDYFTDKLKSLKENNDDELDIDTLHKKHKLGKYSVKTWEERFAERDIDYASVENTMRNQYNNTGIMSILMDEQLDNMVNEHEIDRENNDLSNYYGEDGNDDPYGEDNYDE